MNIIETKSSKRKYKSPELIKVELDNEISLVLQSVKSPPWGPDEDIMSVGDIHRFIPYDSRD